MENRKNDVIYSDINAKQTGYNINNFRIEKGLTREQLAELVHVSDRTVANWERGSQRINVVHLRNLATVLSVTENDILCLVA